MSRVAFLMIRSPCHAEAGNSRGVVSYPAADLQPADGGRSFGLAVGASDFNGSLASFSNSGEHLSLVAQECAQLRTIRLR